MAESKYLNKVDIEHQVQTRDGVPSDYHCQCDYCKNFMGEIFNNDVNKHYSNRIRKDYYVDEAGDHLDAGHIIGYRWAIQNLCPEDGIVLDPTVGTGTTIIESINNKRDAIGIELEYPEVAQKNIDAQLEYPRTKGRKYWFRQGNAIKLDEYLDEWEIKKGDIDLIINGTPYPKLSGKSSDAPERKNLKTGEDKSFDYYHEENIGITKGDEYWNLVRTMYSKSISYLKPGGYLVILIKDLVQNKKPYLLHKHIVDVILEANPDMNHFGFFLHSHSPTTMFQNTYGKRFSGVQIPWYQTGIVLRKEGGKDPGFRIPKNSMTSRMVPYKLHDMDSGYRVNYRNSIGEVEWETAGGMKCNAPSMEAKVKPKKKVKQSTEITGDALSQETVKEDLDLSQFKSPGISMVSDERLMAPLGGENLQSIEKLNKMEYLKTDTEPIPIDCLLKPEDFRNSSGLEFKDLSDEAYRVYEYPEMEIRIDRPLKLHVSDSGGHRVWDARGVSHYMPAGWRHLYWLVKEGENHFAF